MKENILLQILETAWSEIKNYSFSEKIISLSKLWKSNKEARRSAKQRRLTIIDLSWLRLLSLPLLFLSCFTSSGQTITLTNGGNAQTNANEWATVLTTASITKKALVHDNNNSNDSQFTTGSKDGSILPSGWEWTNGQTNNKGDISNSGAVIIGDYLYFFGDRASINGDAQIGFWFFLNNVSTAGDGKKTSPFTGTHAVGDILILSNFTNGGGNSAIRVYKWVGAGAPDATDGPFRLLAVSSQDKALVNTGSVTVPVGVTYQGQTWAYKNPAVAQYPTGAFFLGQVYLKEPGRQIEGCFSSFLLETRNSQSIDASLQDFVNHTFGGHPAPLVLTGSSICSASPNTGTISSTTSATGISYQIYQGSNPVQNQNPKPGTGLGLTWTGLAAGTGYYVVGSEAGNATCNSTSDSADVAITPNPAPSVADQTVCEGQTATFSTANLGTGFSYQWSSGGIDITDATSYSYTTDALAKGDNGKIYTVTVTKTGTTCAGSDPGTLTVNANPAPPNVTYNPPACDETTFSITIKNVISGATYTVRNKTGGVVSGLSPASPYTATSASDITFSNFPAGAGYQVSVTATTNCSSGTTTCPAPPAGRIADPNPPAEVIQNDPQKVGFTVFPVPFKDQLTVRYNFDYTSPVLIEVFNSQGNIILSKKDSSGTLNKEVQLNLNSKTGQNEVYFVKVTTDRESGIQKVISSR